MSDTYKIKQQETANKLLAENITVNKILLLLNGNSVSDNRSIIRNVECVLRDNSVINITEDFLESKHTKFKKYLEQEYRVNL
jgi:agmatine/peptidylarginine deiminase